MSQRLSRLSDESVVDRIWSKDPSVWGGSGDTVELADRLGWLDAVDRASDSSVQLAEFALDVRSSFDSVVLCGMGGSSLAAEVFCRVVRHRGGYPVVSVLDSTAPAAVRAAADRSRNSLFLISSKSGTTLETTSFLAHFWELTGADASRFVAITDPGTPLHELATQRGFRRIIEGTVDVGGRFSALSPFGLVPAALAGVDIGVLVDGTRRAMESCRRPASEENHGAWLGVVMGEAAAAGRDKLTLSLPAPLASFGLWLEQLVAESTGKSGRGVLPVLDDGSSRLDSYGGDRLFVSLSVASDVDGASAERLDALAQRGHPTVQLTIPSVEDIGGEMFRWEFATAVAGAVLGVNPFDQPNVSESKANTSRVLEQGGATDDLPDVSPVQFESFRAGVRPGDYVAILAYVAPTAALDHTLETIARGIQDRVRVPVTVGYGPRYLHSTGQFHKGGPATGHYIQIVDLPGPDLPVPDAEFSFGDLARAQADADAQALWSRGRPLVRLPSMAALEALVETLD
ncbi:MAG: glucose-6-phosphate isomerase [Gemmatimonadetes bacterium]|nr:glucose-6-phosphate isomerase [Gemmatimonadota bacterium]